MQQINLLNPQLLTTHVAFSSKTIAWMLLGVVVLGLGLYGLVESSAGNIRKQLEQAQAQRDELQARIDALNQPAADGLTQADERAHNVALEKQHIAQLQRMQSGMGVMQGGSTYSARLHALAEGGVSGVWLTDIEFSGPRFRLEGRALQPTRIPDYLALLSRRAALKDLSLTGFRILPPETGADSRTSEPGVVFVVNPSAEAR